MSRRSYMRESMHQLEILDAKLQGAGRRKTAARLIRQALSTTPRYVAVRTPADSSTDHTHRYTLRLLFVDLAPASEALPMLDELDVSCPDPTSSTRNPDPRPKLALMTTPRLSSSPR